MSASLLDLLKLNAVGVSPRALRRVIAGAGDAGVSAASARDWAAWGGFSQEEAAEYRARALAFNAEAELEAARKLGAEVVGESDPRYPDLLASIHDAPLLFYAQGRPPQEDPAPVAFVGTRRPTPYGRRLAARLAGQAAALGAVVVSGLARGIDTESHKAALRAKGRTWAVLGSGLDRLYPPENAALARDIAQSGGCLISEFPLGTPPLAGNFPRRNRIVSGLSWGTVVVEGESRSGSLITARLAAEQGREVFAVPGPADSPMSDAPHLLLTQGAKLVRSIEDILAELPADLLAAPPPHKEARDEDKAPFAKQNNKILELLRSDACSVEELARETGLTLPRLTSALLELELQDLVVPVEGQRYAKK